MSDFRVQHFEIVVNAADATTDVPIPLPVRMANTRIILSSPGRQMQTLGNSVSDPLNTRDLQCALELIDVSTVRIHKSPNARYNAVVSFSLMEYTGATGGPNEFTVQRIRVANDIASNGADLTALGFTITFPAKTTTHIVGVILDNELASDTDGDFHGAVQMVPTHRFITDFDTIEFYQLWNGNSNHATWTYLEQVVWSGSNWTITFAPFGQGTADRSDTITFTTAGSPGKTVELGTTIDWGTSWVEAYRMNPLYMGIINGEGGVSLQPQNFPTSTSVIAFTIAGSETANEATNGATLFLISNPTIFVAQQGSYRATGPAQFFAGNPKTFLYDVIADVGKISPPLDIGFCVLMGNPAGKNGFSDPGIQYNGDGEIIARRSRGTASFTDITQTIALGDETSESGTIEDMVIRQPAISVTIKSTRGPK